MFDVCVCGHLVIDVEGTHPQHKTDNVAVHEPVFPFTFVCLVLSRGSLSCLTWDYAWIHARDLAMC